MIRINNRIKLISFLKFIDKDDFYYITIQKRKSDNPDMTTLNEVIEGYVITSNEQLQQLEQKIIEVCKSNNARAVINSKRGNYKEAESRLKNYKNKGKHTTIEDNALYNSRSKTDHNWYVIDIDYIMKEDELDKIKMLTGIKDATILNSLKGHTMVTENIDIKALRKNYPSVTLLKNKQINLYIP